MTATEELRRLLDERGVEWNKGPFPNEKCTYWRNVVAKPWDDERIYVMAIITPTQAVTATMGRGTCRMILREDIYSHAYQDIYECNVCGEQVIRETYMGESEPPRYCPNCGREVIENEDTA